VTSIFPALSLDRAVSRWEEHLWTLTPWEFHQGVWFKREDYFAPLGYGGPNGSKMRQLIYAVNRYGYLTHRSRIITGASVQSPQLSMTAIMGAHYGMPVTQVVYSKPSTLMSHPNPAIAAGFGATFDYAKGPYNPILQARVDALAAADADALVVEYGISLPLSKYGPEAVRDFHAVGAVQTANLPPSVRRLIVPAGSCNTLCSVLMGLIDDPGNLEQLYTLGIGPDKRDWALERLTATGVLTGPLPFEWKHHSLHETGFSTYSEKFQGERFRGIDFHPTYEAKMWRYLRRHDAIEQDGRTGFWIVGSEAQRTVVEPFYTHPENVG